MRNLKRALSLALASVMLLGMMVVGTSAAFTDSDQIVNTEAVEITAGLGLFAGNPDGSFNPKGTVTRAQMATVIAKMLYGSDVDADAYKGSGKFSDVANFEGGWAEGYVNICAGNNIISGYPDGTFKPGQAVTTAEASVMIIKALKVEVPAGTWPTNVMVKADEMELFDELAVKPGANVALNRDQLASIVWEGMNYSAEGVQGYKVSGSNITFKTWSDAVEYYKADNNGSSTGAIDAISEVKNDTLAETVFEIETATGYITANQATGEDCTVVAGLPVNLETGLDMLGHYVTVYYKDTYKSENKPGTAYCVVEQADYVVVKETIGTYSNNTWTGDKKDYLAAFGSKVEMDTVTNNNVTVTNVVTFTNAGTYQAAAQYNGAYDKDNFVAPAGTYAIDKESGKIIAYMAPIAVAFDEITRVSNIAGKETIRVGNQTRQNNEDLDEVFEYDGIAEDDIVAVKTYTDSEQNTVYYLEKAEVVSGKITKTGTVDKKPATYIDGTAYINDNFVSVAQNLLDATANYAPDATTTYDAYLYNGKLVGVKQTSSTADLSEVVYVINTYKTEEIGQYNTKTEHYYAQGIDATGKEVSILIGIQGCGEKDAQGNLINTGVTDQTFGNDGFYTFKKSTTDKEWAKKGIMDAAPAKILTNQPNDPLKFDPAKDDFFAGAGTTITNGKIEKSDKYITVDGARTYLTADTKYIVVEKPGNTVAELDIATYVGGINKTLTQTVNQQTVTDTVAVAATQDVNGNKLAAIVVIATGAVSLAAEDYIYVVDGNDYSLVGDGDYEYTVYFTATNKFETIVTDGQLNSNTFYDDYEIDEDGVYTNMGAADYQGYEMSAEEITGIFGTSITTRSNNIDLLDAANAVIVDVRGEEWIKDDSEINFAIETLEDIQKLLNDDYRVFFDVLLEDGTGTTKDVAYIFITNVKTVKLDQSYNPMAGYDQQGAPIENNWTEA